MDQNIDFFGDDQIQTPQYPNDFQKKFEQKQEDFLNQMRNFMQNFHDGPPIPPPGKDREHEATTDTELPSTEDIQPHPDQEPPQDSDIFAPILPTKESEHLLSMGYEHLSITPETESGEVTESNAENLLPIPSKCEDGDSQREEIDIVTETDDVLPPSVENDDDLFNDPLLKEVDLFFSDNSIPPGIENIADDPEGDIRFLEELLIDDSILSHESFDSNFEDNPLIPRPPPEPPDAETDIEEEIAVEMNGKDKFDDDYQFFMFDKVFSLLSAKSEDTIFDP
nr:hypothetical protein [Tanacetum cinerariifolium]